MKVFTKNSRLCAGLLFGIVLGSAQAAAQTDESAKPALAQSLSGPAKEAFSSARILLENNDFAGALDKYEQAFDLSKDPRLLFNMAICARGLKEYARMQALLLRYEREAGSAMPAQDRADVDAALAAIRDLVGTVKLTVEEPGATVALDGRAIGTTPLAEPLVVDLGPHTLSIKKPGYEPLEQALTIAGGNDTLLTLTLTAKRHDGELIVSSDEGATVFVDERAVGVGRFDGVLAPGVHELRVSESGKVAYRTEVDLKDGETRTLQVTLENEKHKALIWPWIVGGVAVAAGAAVGGYFLFKPSDGGGSPGPVAGSSSYAPAVQLKSFARR